MRNEPNVPDEKDYSNFGVLQIPPMLELPPCRARFVILLQDNGGLAMADYTGLLDKPPMVGHTLMLPVAKNGIQKGWQFPVGRVEWKEAEKTFECHETGVRKCNVVEALDDLRGANGWKIDDHLWLHSLSQYAPCNQR